MDWEMFYGEVYDILMTHAGAHEVYKDHFVQAALQERNPLTEWRFQGHLGFGGKFWRNGGKIYVACYREDETPKRRKVIDDTNAKLDDLCQKWAHK